MTTEGSHLDAHHHALNALLKVLREEGQFDEAGQLMALHRRNEWGPLRLFAETIAGPSAPAAVRDAASTLIYALDAGPLSPDWVPPEER